MGLGSTAKKIQAVAERAEQLYEQVMELRKRIIRLEESVDETTDQVDQLETETEKQTVLLRALAEQQGLDVDQILADAAIEEAEVASEGDGSADGSDSFTEASPSSDAASGDASSGDTSSGDDSPTVVDSSGDPVE